MLSRKIGRSTPLSVFYSIANSVNKVVTIPRDPLQEEVALKDLFEIFTQEQKLTNYLRTGDIDRTTLEICKPQTNT